MRNKTTFTSLLMFISGFLACQSEDKEPPKPSQYLQGQVFNERKHEQETLRQGLAELRYFSGDGQLRFQSGGYHGSAFWFNKKIIMTNDHVVEGHSLADLEYISFPDLVLYRTALKNRVQDYIKTRLDRANKSVQDAISILQRRIKNLTEFSQRDTRLNEILYSYENDIKLLQTHTPRKIEDITFIPIETTVDTIYRSGQTGRPDIALIVLKKPIDALLQDLGIALPINNDWFAEHSLYRPQQHGFIYAGTPMYIAGYGRSINGSATDKNKSLTPMRVGFNQSKDLIYNMSLYERLWWEMEKEFYYFQASAQGDSGARMWAFLDSNNRISHTPSPLHHKQVTIGINNSTGGGIIFSKDSLAPFAAHINLGPLPPAFETVIPQDLHYLLNIDTATPPEFIAALNWFVLDKGLRAQQRYDAEEAYLWFIVDVTLPTINTLLAEMQGFENEVNKAVMEFFNHSKAAPSEISDAQWDSIASSSMSQQQKALFEKMRLGKLFDEFDANFRLKLKNVTTPIKVADYIAALGTWVSNNKYKRTTNYEPSLQVKLSQPHASFASLAEIIKALP